MERRKPLAYKGLWFHKKSIVSWCFARRGVNEKDARSLGLTHLECPLLDAMHLRLLLGGIEIVGVAIIIPSVRALGYFCEMARAGSLRPAIAAHLMLSIGGVLAGVTYTIIYRLVTGHLPPV